EEQPQIRSEGKDWVVAGAGSFTLEDGSPEIRTPGVPPGVRKMMVGAVRSAQVVAPEQDKPVLVGHVDHSPVRSSRWLDRGRTRRPGVVAWGVGPDVPKVSCTIEAADEQNCVRQGVVRYLGVRS